LPEGVAASDLPLLVQSIDDGLVTVQTDDELRALHTLTGWALDKGLTLPGLSVLRVSLEDVYLDLTRSAQ
jgi:ABC-2 type transport system ATP-binding protein